jgi:hypothetical protein
MFGVCKDDKLGLSVKWVWLFNSKVLKNFCVVFFIIHCELYYTNEDFQEVVEQWKQGCW